MKTLLIVALVACLILALVMILVPRGPSVTQITRTRTREDESEDGE
jgi:uncharacterized OsmC-like protein